MVINYYFNVYEDQVSFIPVLAKQSKDGDFARLFILMSNLLWKSQEMLLLKL